MTQGMTGGRFLDRGDSNGLADAALHRILVQVMTTPGAGARISGRSIGREYVLPAEVEVRARILPLQRARQLHPAVTCRNGALVACAQSGDLPAQRLDETVRQHGHAILHTLGVANNELSLAEINVLHSEVQSFKQA